MKRLIDYLKWLFEPIERQSSCGSGHGNPPIYYHLSPLKSAFCRIFHLL